MLQMLAANKKKGVFAVADTSFEKKHKVTYAVSGL